MAEKREYTLVGHEKPYRFDEDGLHVTRGCAWSAPGCHIGCGVLLYTDDEGRLVKVEGDPENPSTRAACASAASTCRKWSIRPTASCIP